MYTFQTVKTVLTELSQHPIAFQVVYARIAGSALAGLMLSQAVYWSSTLPTERDGWFYKSATEWEAETGMTESEQQTARKRLRNIGVWDEKQHPSSLNRSKWFRVDMEKLIELIVSHSANPGYANQESAGCYTETTAEIPYKREARKPRASRSEKRPWIPLGPDEEKPGHKLLAQVISVPDKG